MNTLNANKAAGAPRRNFFRLAGATMLGLAGLASAASRAQAATPVAGDGLNWPGKLKGRHRQVFDAYAVNGGFPLVFASTFLLTDPPPGSATSVVILRSQGLVIALNSAVWEKYKIGELLKIIDPETKAPAVKNPFVNPKPGVLATERFGRRPAARKRCGIRRLQRGAAWPKQTARQQRRRERGRRGQGMGCEPGAGNHPPSIRGVGSEPRAGGRLHLLHGRLKTLRSHPGQFLERLL